MIILFAVNYGSGLFSAFLQTLYDIKVLSFSTRFFAVRSGGGGYRRDEYDADAGSERPPSASP